MDGAGDNPRRNDPASVTPYIVPVFNSDSQGDLETGFKQLITIGLGLAGLMLKNPWMSWAALVMGVASLSTGKFVERDFKSTAMTFGLAFTGIIANYARETAMRAHYAAAGSA